jgi:N-acetylneuraminic acid mutarotase
MSDLKLFMVIIGCTPKGRFTEQHDVFFGIGKTLRELIPEMNAFWKEAEGKIHIDAWREIKTVDGYAVRITEKQTAVDDEKTKLFFINLGGYKEKEFEEYHYKIIAAAKDKGEAIRKSKQTVFYKHYGFKGAESHIDDKYGIDVDDLYQIDDILPDEVKEKYSINLNATNNNQPDELHIGYLMIDKC